MVSIDSRQLFARVLLKLTWMVIDWLRMVKRNVVSIFVPEIINMPHYRTIKMRHYLPIIFTEEMSHKNSLILLQIVSKSVSKSADMLLKPSNINVSEPESSPYHGDALHAELCWRFYIYYNTNFAMFVNMFLLLFDDFFQFSFDPLQRIVNGLHMAIQIGRNLQV